MSSPSKVTIVGAGLCGPLLAAYLARRGFEVAIYERRGDLRREAVEDGKSIKLTLAERGLAALAELGLTATVMKFCVPLRGRAVHDGRGLVNPIPYGKNNREVIYAFSRADLNAALLDHLETFSNVRLHFHQRCVRVEKDRAAVVLENTSTGETTLAEADVLIGADGAFSVVRQQMQRGERVDFRQDFLAWGYQELSIAATAPGRHAMDRHAFHVWPNGDHMLFCLPNVDGSFSGVCVLPFEGQHSFAALRREADIVALFAECFGDVMPLMPRLLEEFTSRKTSEFLTIRTSQWHYKGKVALIGDACHSVVPFYGQGMNAGFEDCVVLDRCIALHGGDWEAAFAEYQALRKPNTDILADLSIENFHELRDTVRRPIVAARKRTSIFLNRIFSSTSVPLYTMIAHSTLPYAECLQSARRQERIARCLGLDLVVGVVALYLRLRNALAKWRAARQEKRPGSKARARAGPVPG